MNEAIQAAILGLMQGLAEFLPISSSAHLVIIPEILGWVYMGKAFDVALHFGTLLALFVTFKTDVAMLLRGTKNWILSGFSLKDEETHLVKLLIIGSIPAALIGLKFEKQIEQYCGGLLWVATMLIAWALLLEWADRGNFSRERTVANLTLGHAFAIGCAQAAALMPGTSRSGSTITLALFLGLTRVEAARFSFLLSLPVVGGASILKGIKIAKDPSAAEMMMPLAVGITVSAVSGFLCIKYFLKFLRDYSFRPFVVYRILLGLFLIYWAVSHATG